MKTGEINMRIAVTNFVTVSPNSIVASNRLANWLAEMLGADLLDEGKKFEEHFHDKYDAIIAVNGIPVYCKHRDIMYDFWHHQGKENHPKFYWVGQDYNGHMKIQLGQWEAANRDCDFKLLAAFEPQLWGKYAPDADHYHYMNWNKLTFTPGVPPIFDPEHPDTLFYYGAFRHARVGKWIEYFGKDLGFKTDWSIPSSMAYTAIANRVFESNPVFDENGNEVSKEYHDKHINWLTKIHPSQLVPTIGQYGASLYIEDFTGPTPVYCSPANRWYEGMSSGGLVVVDDYSVSAIKRAYEDKWHKNIDLLSVRPESVGQVLSDSNYRHDMMLAFHEIVENHNHYEELSNDVKEYFKSEGLINGN